MTDILKRIADLKSQPKKPAKPETTAGKKMKARVKEMVDGGKKPVDSRLEKIAEESEAVISQIRSVVTTSTGLTLKITSPGQYAQFDQALSRVIGARKEWRADWEKVAAPMRQAKQALDDLNRKTDRPREALETAIRSSMADWQRGLLVEKQEADRIKQEEADKLRREANEAAQKALTAKTPQMRARLETQAQTLHETADDVADLDTSVNVDADHSHAKYPMVWELVSLLRIVEAVAKGDIPIDVLELNTRVVNVYFKHSQNEVAQWPGIVVKQDVTIVSGNRWRDKE